MSNTYTDLYELHSARIADYRLLSFMPAVEDVQVTHDGSALASSLIFLPDAFNESTATLILDAVPFGYSDQTANMAEHFGSLADKADEEKTLEELDVSSLDLVLDLWIDDQDTAAVLFQDSIDEFQKQRDLGEIEALRMLRAELESEQDDVTVNQLLLLMNQSTRQTAMYAFPNAADMYGTLVAYEPDLSLAEKRRKDRRDREERNRIAGAGNRRTYSISDLETMLMLEDDPVALASMALNTPSVKEDQLLTILEHAESAQLRDWMFAREAVQPKAGQIEKLVKRLPQDRIDEVIRLSHEMLTGESEVDGLMVSNLPYIFEIIENVFVPRVILTPPTAMVVYYELHKRIGDDPSTWTAVLMADTGGDYALYEDLIV